MEASQLEVDTKDMSDEEFIQHIADRTLVDANYVRTAFNMHGRNVRKIVEHITPYRG